MLHRVFADRQTHALLVIESMSSAHPTNAMHGNHCHTDTKVSESTKSPSTAIAAASVHRIGLLVPTLVLATEKPLAGTCTVGMHSRLKYIRVRVIYNTS